MSAGSTTHPENPNPRSRMRLVALVSVLAAALLGTLACGGDVESRLAEVRSLQSAGQYEPSIAPLRKILASESNHAEANFRLGIALVRTARPSLAIWPLQKASQTEEYGIQGGLLLANTLLSQHAHEDSIRAATRVLERDPENLPALFTRARAYLLSGQPEGTLDDAQRVLELRPDDDTASALVGAALIDLDRGSEAETTFVQLAEEAAQSGDEYAAGTKCAQLGTFYRSQQDDEKAIATYDDCLEKYPNHPILRQLVSDYYVNIGKGDDAIGIWRKAVESTPEDYNLRAKLAELLHQEGKNEEALAVIEETVELFDTPQAWRMLSSFKRQVGEVAASREALEEAMDRTRNTSPAMQFALADILIEEGEYDRAEEIAAKLEQPAYKHMLRGAILLSKGDPKGALEKFDAGLRIWPNNAGARYMAGVAALDLGDQERALKEFREAVRIDEAETDAALRLAEIHFQRGQYPSAVQFAERHIANRPFVDSTAHRIGARAATAIGSYERAETILMNLKAHDVDSPIPSVEFAAVKRQSEGPEAATQAILLSGLDLTETANVDALRSLTVDYLALNQSKKALDNVDAAIAAHPDFPPFLLLQAQVRHSAGKRAQALASLDAALAADPDLAGGLAMRGDLAREAGNIDEAISFYDRAAAADTEAAEPLYMAAQSFLMKNDAAGAIERLEAALKRESNHARANNDLAWLLASAGRELDRALRLAKTAVRVEDSADTLDTLGYVHLQMGNSEDAATVLTRALERRPDSSSIGYRLGVALAAKGEKEEAKAVLSKALENPSFPEAEAARVELAKLQDS